MIIKIGGSEYKPLSISAFLCKGWVPAKSGEGVSAKTIELLFSLLRLEAPFLFPAVLSFNEIRCFVHAISCDQRTLVSNEKPTTILN